MTAKSHPQMNPSAKKIKELEIAKQVCSNDFTGK
jgi:hypothetical protein